MTQNLDPNAMLVLDYERCIAMNSQPVILSAKGKFIATLSTSNQVAALHLVNGYRAEKPRIAIDLNSSRLLAIVTPVDRVGDSVESMESKFGSLGSPMRERSSFLIEGKTSAASHLRDIRLVRVTEPVTACALNDIAYVTQGYAPIPVEEPPTLTEDWRTFIATIPKLIAAEKRKLAADEIAWRNGTHALQRPSTDALRLLESIKVSHLGALLDLQAGAVIEDLTLQHALREAGAALGSLSDKPRPRGLEANALRFIAPFRGALGIGGFVSYREGAIIQNVDPNYATQLRRAGAVIEYCRDTDTRATANSQNEKSNSRTRATAQTL